MEWIIFGGAIVYFAMQRTQANSTANPPVGGVHVGDVYNFKKPAKARVYHMDTMAETLDKGLNPEAYKNAQFLNSGASTHYFDVSRRESEKKIHNFADLYNDYVTTVDKKHSLAGHIWKRGKISQGYPDRVNSAGPLPWMIVPYIPKPTDHPLTQQTAGLFKI